MLLCSNNHKEVHNTQLSELNILCAILNKPLKSLRFHYKDQTYNIDAVGQKTLNPIQYLFEVSGSHNGMISIDSQRMQKYKKGLGLLAQTIHIPHIIRRFLTLQNATPQLLTKMFSQYEHSPNKLVVYVDDAIVTIEFQNQKLYHIHIKTPTSTGTFTNIIYEF